MCVETCKIRIYCCAVLGKLKKTAERLLVLEFQGSLCGPFLAGSCS
jgi:hypothetical protein